jgi:hypothetical protein
MSLCEALGLFANFFGFQVGFSAGKVTKSPIDLYHTDT